MDQKTLDTKEIKTAPTPEPPSQAAAKLVISSSPHFLNTESVPKIMHNVVTALLPATAASVYFFGWRALLLIIVCVASCLVTEYAFQKKRNKPIKIYDGSAIITGMLLAMTLPAGFPIFGAIAVLVMAALGGE